MFLAVFSSLLVLCSCQSITGSFIRGATITPNAVHFTPTLVGSQSVARTVTISNSGFAPLTISAISLTGSQLGSFHQFNDCGPSLPVSASCSIQVSFAPTEAVPMAKASIKIVGDGSTAGVMIPLIGLGSTQTSADVLVYGATPAGIMAAVAAAVHGKKVTLLDPENHVGGIMTNGLGYSDEYGDAIIGGLPKTFYSIVNDHYRGSKINLRGQVFEPHVAENSFDTMLARHSGIAVAMGTSFQSVQMNGTAITGIVASNGTTYTAKQFIDASYTGDLMAAAGVTYTVGRESVATYNEALAGVNSPNKMGNQSIDAYVVRGDSSSGLIAHVKPTTLPAQGSADTTVMGYNYRMCLSSDPSNQIPFPQPVNYNPAEYELLGRMATDMNPPLRVGYYLDIHALPGLKFDWNNTRSFFSTDEVGENYRYPDGSAEERRKIAAEQRRYMEGFIHFILTDKRIPPDVLKTAQGLGLCKDEFLDNGGWPNQIYVREARRMLGSYVATQHDLEMTTAVQDSIGVGGYTSDDHLHHILSVNGIVHYEANRGYQPRPYPISYRVLTPRESEATNLLVPVDVSASHVAYDSLRVEVTYMIMGQAAGTAAALAIDGNTTVQGVSYGTLSSQLLNDGAVITPP